jgi:hypothetical protein
MSRSTIVRAASRIVVSFVTVVTGFITKSALMISPTVLSSAEVAAVAVVAFSHQLFFDVFTCTTEIVLTTFVLPQEGHLFFSLIRLSYSESDQICSKVLSHFSQ